mgnify:CR=1 FL=1
MQQYEEVSIKIICFQMDDIVTASPGGIDYSGKDENGDEILASVDDEEKLQAVLSWLQLVTP